MAQSQTSPEVVQLFKKVYGKTNDLLPNDQIISKLIAWNDSQKVGEKFIETCVLGHEVGISLLGSGSDPLEINQAIAGAVKNVEVSAYASVLKSRIPWQVISRSLGTEQAFFNATKHIVKNNISSHEKLKEIFRLYGQATYKLGRVFYGTKTFRGISFTTGSGTIAYQGTDIAFTNGVNTSSKLILLAGDFAPGNYVGLKDLQIQQYNSSNVVVAEGSLVGWDAVNNIIEVDFTPVAATSLTSHHIGIRGQDNSGEMIGIQKILSTNGSLFGLNNNQYPLFKGTQYALNNVKLTLGRLETALAYAVNAAGLEGDVTVLVNPLTHANMVTTESGLRVYDKSYMAEKSVNGFKDIEVYYQAGKATIKSHRGIKENEAFVLYADGWSRSGSAEISFKIPGMGEDLIQAEENMTAYSFRSYSDEYVFCVQPAKNIYISGIDPEAAS